MRARGGALKENAGQLRRVAAVAIMALTLAFGCASMKPKGSSDSIEHFAGTWSWGSPRRSAQVPFLKIFWQDSGLVIQTKHYLHDSFVDDTKDTSIYGSHLEFSYWYAPLCRWAKCSLDLAGDRMNGKCEGEVRAGRWGEMPAYLWREDQTHR